MKNLTLITFILALLIGGCDLLSPDEIPVADSYQVTTMNSDSEVIDDVFKTITYTNENGQQEEVTATEDILKIELDKEVENPVLKVQADDTLRMGLFIRHKHNTIARLVQFPEQGELKLKP